MTAQVDSTYSRERCCWICKEPGHSYAFCENPSREFCSYCGRDGILAKNCDCPKPGIEPVYRKEDDRCPDVLDTRPYVNVDLGSVNVLALVDCGSVASFVHPRIAEICEETGYEVGHANVLATMADGSERSLEKTIGGVVTVNNIRINHTFLVMELDNYVILGMDILVKLGLSISLGDSVLWSNSVCGSDNNLYKRNNSMNKRLCFSC